MKYRPNYIPNVNKQNLNNNKKDISGPHPLSGKQSFGTITGGQVDLPAFLGLKKCQNVFTKKI